MMDNAPTLTGIMGWPVGHTLSPRLHGFWLRKYALNGVYIPMPVYPDCLEQALRALPALGFRGVNLTIPHKEKAAAIVDHLGLFARRIGAVNCVVVRDDGTLEGRNTDATGFIKNLESAGFNAAATSKTAIVLGAGGAARAVIVALQEMGLSEICLVNRSRERAEDCQQDLINSQTKIVIGDSQNLNREMSRATILVNATSLGMTGQPPLHVDLTALPKEAWVTDLVYTPLETDLLKEARRFGHRTVDGLGMLLHQAAPCFATWFGREPEVTDDLRRFVLEKAG